ncbi:MAG: radical SAM protein [Elusimicrobia bacterium]|nr:radical SAM protein [Elusimicrobiota bacterium]
MDKIIFKDTPKNVQIDVNNFCNLSCPMCASRERRQGNKITPENMSIENFKIIASKLNFPAHFTFGNKSEPLVNPEIFNMIKCLRTVNKGAYTQVLSNFNLLENFGVETLVNSGVDHILVGLDGTNSEMYAKYRIGGNFDTVIKNIKAVQKYKKDHNISTPLMEIVFVVFKHNEHVLQKAKDMAKSLDCAISFRHTDCHAGFESWFPQSIDFSSEEFNLAPRANWAEELPFNAPCKEPWLKMNIYHNGEVCTCCSDAKISAGNIFKQNFNEIWNGTVYQSARSVLLGGKANTAQANACLECPVYTKNNCNAFDFKVD